jgi:hypothetical protein
MDFKEIEKLLSKYGFFGFTVGRKDKRLSYTFRSISNYAIVITVEVIRVNPETFKTTKLVGRITINDREIEDLIGLKKQLDNIYQLQKKEREKLYKRL